MEYKKCSEGYVIQKGDLLFIDHPMIDKPRRYKIKRVTKKYAYFMIGFKVEEKCDRIYGPAFSLRPRQKWSQNNYTVYTPIQKENDGEG